MDTKSKFSPTFLFLLSLLILRVCAVPSAASYPITFNRSVADSYPDAEMLMESEISRRFLAQTKGIGYDALKRDQPACGGERGKSYSGSCLPPPSNPSNRGCSKTYRCRDGS